MSDSKAAAALHDDSDIISRMSSLSIETHNTTLPRGNTQYATLAIMQPLKDPNMLAACRNPASKVLRRADGSVCGPSDSEFLNIEPLGMAWRQALLKVPAFSQITFDLSLPKEGENTAGQQKVYWQGTGRSEGELGINTQEVFNLVILLATTTRMRTKSDLKFEVTWGESYDERPRPDTMAGLHKRLLSLEKRPPKEIKDDGERPEL
jgi:hypothetical protein